MGDLIVWRMGALSLLRCGYDVEAVETRANLIAFERQNVREKVQEVDARVDDVVTQPI